MMGMFGGDKKTVDELKLKNQLLTEQVAKLQCDKAALTDEIDAVYEVLINKDTFIRKLRSIINENLDMPQLKAKYETIGSDITDLFAKVDSYDPREARNNRLSRKNHIQIDSSSTALTDSEFPEQREGSLDRQSEEDISQSEIKAEQDTEAIDSHNQGQSELRLVASSQEKDEMISQTVSEPKASSTVGTLPLDKIYSLIKMKQDRKFNIKPREKPVVARELFTFELELKEYTYSSFESVRQFVTKSTFTTEEIHEEVTRLAAILVKMKYFKTIFPVDTYEHVSRELENYIYEVLYPKLFIVDEDTKAFSQQLKDRLTVLKDIITFEMLDILEPMRKESLYTFAIKELEKLNVLKSTLSKTQAIQNCVNHLIDMYLELIHRNPNSDELFPMLVYVVLQAKVDNMKMNLDYIFTNLRESMKLGQEGFLIVNFKAVIRFLNDLDGNGLKEGKLELKDSSKLFENL